MTPNFSTEKFDAAVKRLAEIQKDISLHSKAWDAGKREAGKILLQLREAAPHGTWDGELKKILAAAKISQATAYRYMNLAEGIAVKANPKTSLNGYDIDVLKSALQKAIRTQNEKLAWQCTVELDLSHKTAWLWERFHTFASEDIGLVRIGLHREIDDLHAKWKSTHREMVSDAHQDEHPDRVFLANAILMIVRCEKSRLTDNTLITYYFNQQPIEIPEDFDANAAYESHETIEIPDAAFDKHTAVGRNKLGRKGAAGINHFFDEGAKLVNETTQPDLQDTYKESARQALLSKVKGGAA